MSTCVDAVWNRVRVWVRKYVSFWAAPVGRIPNWVCKRHRTWNRSCKRWSRGSYSNVIEHQRHCLCLSRASKTSAAATWVRPRRQLQRNGVDRPPNSNFLLYPSKLRRGLFIVRYRNSLTGSQEGSNAQGVKLRSQNIYVVVCRSG